MAYIKPTILSTFLIVGCFIIFSREAVGQLVPTPDPIGSNPIDWRSNFQRFERGDLGDSLMLHEISNCNACVRKLQTECVKVVEESECQPCSETRSITLGLPIFDDDKGFLDEIRFRKPSLQNHADNAFVDSFDVTVRNVSGRPSEHVLVAGVIKTSAKHLKSEVELQLDVLSQSDQVIRIRSQTISNVSLDPAGSLRLFVKLVNSTTSKVLDEKYSEEWKLSELKVDASGSRIRPDQHVVIRLPY